MAKTTRYTVTAPLVAVPSTDGADRFYYEGDPLPEDLNEAVRDRLVTRRLIKKTPEPRSSVTDES